MEADLKKIAFVGLGVMGVPVASRIHAAGWNLHAYDLAEAARLSAARRGIAVHSQLKVCVEKADVVFLMLPTAIASKSVVLDVLDLSRPVIVVELGTIGCDTARECASLCSSKGVAYLDSPVIG